MQHHIFMYQVSVRLLLLFTKNLRLRENNRLVFRGDRELVAAAVELVGRRGNHGEIFGAGARGTSTAILTSCNFHMHIGGSRVVMALIR